MINIKNVSKDITIGKNSTYILDNISLSVKAGEIFAIEGKSGCGKSTLLSILSGLDKPTSGSVLIKNKNIYQLNERNREIFRNQNIGIIFQNYHLIPELTCEENIRMPLVFSKKEIEDDRVQTLLKVFGLSSKVRLFPKQLSGGEQQRTAIARALVNQPSILFADEPTGALDKKTGDGVVKYLIDCSHKLKMTVVLVTHDMEIANQCDRIIHMEDGKILE